MSGFFESDQFRYLHEVDCLNADDCRYESNHEHQQHQASLVLFQLLFVGHQQILMSLVETGLGCCLIIDLLFTIYVLLFDLINLVLTFMSSIIYFHIAKMQLKGLPILDNEGDVLIGELHHDIDGIPHAREVAIDLVAEVAGSQQ